MARVALLLAVLAFGLTTTTRAQTPHNDKPTPVDWAWEQIRNDRIANFNDLCGKPDPRSDGEWNDQRGCRQIPARFLESALTDPSLRGKLPRNRVRIHGALIEEGLDLSDTDITAEVQIEASKIVGTLDLSESKWERSLSIEGSTVARVLAEGMRSKSSLYLRKQATFDVVELKNAKIDGQLDMSGSSFQAVNADSVHVGAHLIMSERAIFWGEVTLRNANIGGVLNMEGALFGSKVDADSLHVGSNLLMSDVSEGAFFGGEVRLPNAKIDGQLNMNRGTFASKVDAEGVRVGAYLLMSEGASFEGEVILAGANIGGILYMNRASFASTVNAQNVHVGVHLRMGDDEAIPGGHKSIFKGVVLLRGATVDGELDMRGSSFAASVDASGVHVGSSLFMGKGAVFGGKVDLTGATIRGSADLSDSTATEIDFTGSEARELVLTGLRWTCPKGEASTSKNASKPAAEAAPVRWPLGDPPPPAPCGKADATKLPTLNLRNLHVDAFQDSPDAWPPFLELEGFHYDRIGGIGANAQGDMRTRTTRAWTDWLARDSTFSTQPYTQLANVLIAAGHRDTAEAIQFAGREGERREAWKRVREAWDRLGPDTGSRLSFLRAFGAWLWLSFLCFVAGYGIGLYTFFVLGWVIGLTVLGACVLRYSPYACRRGLFWCLGASLHRLLPVVELNKEFKDFFDNPPPAHRYEPPNLNRFQVAFFSGLAIAGWILSFFLLAAIGGLTQKG